ncbi:acyl-CoA desaturase [Komarekiella sp. 'clone 1']|uniref:Acyl-CoA desaturase n=1 Tax=Komarekiella delphini-convector SJRDD-AB1 TaxID=2593771 RepID=A0AA40VTX6_9NOST|nr:acyl-CoA desaturase [Komarekiella delphini-convector]MBD6619620.1 acyl-CoA desaturase [Komarekiella delphini-convector SJRDD-AB1]
MSTQPDNISQEKLLLRVHQGQKITIASDYLQTIYRRLALATFLIPCLKTVVAIGLLWYLKIPKDLLQDPVISKVNQLHYIWVILGLIIPTLLGGILTWTWIGSFQGFLWGGLVRVFLGQQIISSTNSICHLYGDRPFDSHDHSTNNILLAIFSCGQSWHNNHHAFPNSAIAGFEWWQIDPGTWFIRFLEFFGLIWNVNIPTAKMIEAKKLRS